MCERGTFAGSPLAFYLGTGFPFPSYFALPYQLQNKKPPDWVVSCFGADDQIRTDYLVLTKDALYLLSYISKKWQGQKDSNPRHVVLETTALPAELYPYITL